MMQKGYRIPALDGLRGLAALWVLIGHAMILTGWGLPVIRSPDLGVDLFIMLSGFLMVMHYREREEKEPWIDRQTWLRFWIRRYFRISPLFYACLAVALFFGSSIYEARHSIDLFLGLSPQIPDRYLDNGAKNTLLHASFFFGIFPQYAFRTALPDWSLGLEMQYYAAFPFLMLTIRSHGAVLTSFGVTIACLLILTALNSFQIFYPMPSLLAFKINIFLCGMLLALCHGASGLVKLRYLAVAMTLVAFSVFEDRDIAKAAIRLILTICFCSLILYEDIPGRTSAFIGAIASKLGNRFFHWLGELSYGSYLIHLLILQPVISTLISQFGTSISAPVRFALAIGLTLPFVYVVAWLTYQMIELPGQRLGRWVLMRSRSTRPHSTAPFSGALKP